MRRIFWVLIGLALSPLVALAANEVTVTDSVTLVLPADSSEYSLFPGTFDSLSVSSNSFTFGMSEGSSVEMTSSDKKNFSPSPSLGASTQCESSQSRIFLSKGSGASTENVAVSPSGACTSGVGGGGSPSLGSTAGGGGGGAAAPAPTVTPTTIDKVALLKKQIAEVQARIAEKLAQAKAPAVVPPAFGVFSRDLVPGQRDEEVKRLQELLAQDKGIYPEGIASGFYGTLTTNAVRRFQLKYGVIKNANDSGNGRTGPKTRAKLNELFGEAPAAPVLAAPAPAPAPAPTAPQAAPEQLKAIQDQIKALQVKIIQEQIKLIQEKIKALQK